MILLCGISSEYPMAMVQEALRELDVPYLFFDQRRFDHAAIDYGIDNGKVTGLLTLEDESVQLDNIASVYTRLMDDQLLPELQNEPPQAARRQQCRALHDTLMRWCEVGPTRVVNRTGPMGSNSSKPFQLQLIREHGFAIPETLITNDPELVLDLRKRHKRVVYKSISGVRSIVQALEDNDLKRLEDIRWCPTQFQEFVEGLNVRVHTVGEELFATSIETTAVDYRYATRFGYPAPELKPISLPEELCQHCLDLARALKLEMAGIDLKLGLDGQVYCFEVNPSPAFSYYEASTGQPIAEALARYLANRQ
jgi:glutathione synthase/RimK-type ligase-like ATP-grasp enzyme